MTQSTPSTTTTAPAANIFSDKPVLIPMVVIAVVLVAMAQFGSTERLAAAFAWLIFFAVLFADGETAFTNLTHLISSPPATFNTGSPPAGTNPNIR